jgi:hypothetical protein
MELGYNPAFNKSCQALGFWVSLGVRILRGPRGRVQRLEVRGNKTPQTERDPRGKVKNLHLQQLEKTNKKKKRDKYLLIELSKNTFKLGWKNGNNH